MRSGCIYLHHSVYTCMCVEYVSHICSSLSLYIYTYIYISIYIYISLSLSLNRSMIILYIYISMSYPFLSSLSIIINVWSKFYLSIHMWLAHIFLLAFTFMVCLCIILLIYAYLSLYYIYIYIYSYLLFTNAFAHTHTYIYIYIVSYADEKLNETGDACCASMSSSNPLISTKKKTFNLNGAEGECWIRHLYYPLVI